MTDRSNRGRALGAQLAQGLRVHAQEVREEKDVDLNDVMKGAAGYLEEWLDAQELLPRDEPPRGNGRRRPSTEPPPDPQSAAGA